ncbi:membrane protease YdiL (CAAX protease family) [Deinobacterium chartae]|uniref:Membrane protease YdiL (CAAX protease family) n=1 Tax=Deinobacterium chartae TaxID=521158 RepID=A0A841HXR6_9DEIO|nr:CPBP family intramembrane glutamic endopeptidase [Deinobacterium chartae]MBB6098331.1 membrane protease YdiL (CAAX protease family) [Deinobacterium chartae]
MNADTPADVPAPLPRFLAAALVCGSAIALYGLEARLVGYSLLAAGLIVAALLGRDARPLLRHLALIGVSLFVISLVPLKADLSNEAILRFTVVLSLAVLIPLVVSRRVLHEDIIRFPVRNTRWTRFEWTYFAVVVALGYLVLPVYFIGSGAYRNWPTVTEPDEITRLFVGVNAVGLWDELFFICTVFALLRQHFSFWQANALQATVFVSFLWELGYQAWGPFLTIPFALLQGYIFYRTKSFLYVLIVHLSFDIIIWMILIHAHTPRWFDIFVTSPR